MSTFMSTRIPHLAVKFKRWTFYYTCILTWYGQIKDIAGIHTKSIDCSLFSPFAVITGAWTAHAPLRYSTHIISVNTYLEQLSHLLRASPWSPSYWKRNSFCGQRGAGGRHRRLVCASRMDVLPCEPPLRSASPLFSPLFSEGRELWASSPSSPHSHSCFSHATSRSSLKIKILIPACFFSSTSSGRFYFCKDTAPSPVFTCSHSCIKTASGRVCHRQRATQHNCPAENHRSLFPGKLTAQPNLQHPKGPYLLTLINQVTVSFT